MEPSYIYIYICIYRTRKTGSETSFQTNLCMKPPYLHDVFYNLKKPVPKPVFDEKQKPAWNPVLKPVFPQQIYMYDM